MKLGTRSVLELEGVHVAETQRERSLFVILLCWSVCVIHTLSDFYAFNLLFTVHELHEVERIFIYVLTFTQIFCT